LFGNTIVEGNGIDAIAFLFCIIGKVEDDRNKKALAFDLDKSEIVEHSDLQNCKEYPDTVQVNKIIISRGYYVRVSVMAFMRASVTQAIRRMDAIEESTGYLKDWIKRTPRHLHPGKFNPELYWKNLGDQGITVGVNIHDGSIHSVALRQTAHANKWTTYEQMLVNSINSLIEAKPKLRNVYSLMEIIGLIGCTNNHYVLSICIMDLACSQKHPLLDGDGPLPEMGLFELIVDKVKRTTGGFTSGPNDRCTVFKNQAFNPMKLRELMEVMDKIRRESDEKAMSMDRYSTDRLLMYFTGVLMELNRPTPGSGLFSLQTVIRVMAGVGLIRSTGEYCNIMAISSLRPYVLTSLRPAVITGVCTVATLAPDVSHFKGNPKGEDATGKPNAKLREYLSSVEKQSFMKTAALVQEGIIHQIERSSDVPLFARLISLIEEDNIYCEERRKKKRCDPFLAGGNSWFEVEVEPKTGQAVMFSYTPTMVNGSVTMIKEKVDLSRVRSKLNKQRPTSLIWKPSLKKVEKDVLKGTSIPIKLDDTVPHEDVIFVKINRDVLKSKGIWSLVKSEFAVKEEECTLPLAARYKNSLKRLSNNKIFIDVVHNKLIQDISPGSKIPMKAEKRRTRLNLLEISTWVNHERLLYYMQKSTFYRENSLQNDKHKLDSSTDHEESLPESIGHDEPPMVPDINGPFNNRKDHKNRARKKQKNKLG
jgi:hypothetical protein